MAAEQRQQHLGLVGVIPCALSQPDMASPRSPRPPPHDQPAAANASDAAAPAAPAAPVRNKPTQRSEQPFVATASTPCPDNLHADALDHAAAEMELLDELVARGFQKTTNIGAPRIKGVFDQLTDSKLIQKADDRATYKAQWNGTLVAAKVMTIPVALDLREPMEVHKAQQRQQQQQRPQRSASSSATAAAVGAPSSPKLSPEAVAAAAEAFGAPDYQALVQEARCTQVVHSAVAASCPSKQHRVMHPVVHDTVLVPPPPGCPRGVWHVEVVLITPWAEGGSLTDRLAKLLEDAVYGSMDWCCAVGLLLQGVDVLKTFRTACAIAPDYKFLNLVVGQVQGGAGGQLLEVVSAIDLDGARVMAGPLVDGLRALMAGPDQQLQQMATKLLQLLPQEMGPLTMYFAPPEMVMGLYGGLLLMMAGTDQATWEGLLAQLRQVGKGVVRLAELARAGLLTPGNAPSLFQNGGESFVCGASEVFLLGSNIEYWLMDMLSRLQSAGRPLTAQDLAAVQGLAELAERCMAALPEQRPSLEEVEAEMQRLAQQQWALDVQEEGMVRCVVGQQQVMDLPAARQLAQQALLQQQQQQLQLQAAWQQAEQMLLQQQQQQLQLQAALQQAEQMLLQQQQQQLQLQAALLQAQMQIQLQVMGLQP